MNYALLLIVIVAVTIAYLIGTKNEKVPVRPTFGVDEAEAVKDALGGELTPEGAKVARIVAAVMKMDFTLLREIANERVKLAITKKQAEEAISEHAAAMAREKKVIEVTTTRVCELDYIETIFED